MNATAHDETEPQVASDITDPRWRDDAACRNTNPDLFFPEAGANEDGRAAKAICAVCPVIDPCREYAVTLTGVSRTSGIWGGTTEHERVAIRRARRAAS